GGIAAIDTAAGTTLTLSTGLGAGAADFSKKGNGTLVLHTASTRSGNSLVFAGTLRAESNTALGTAGSGYVSVLAGSTLELAAASIDKQLFIQTGSTLRGVSGAGSLGSNS